MGIRDGGTKSASNLSAPRIFHPVKMARQESKSQGWKPERDVILMATGAHVPSQHLSGGAAEALAPHGAGLRVD